MTKRVWWVASMVVSASVASVTACGSSGHGDDTVDAPGSADWPALATIPLTVENGAWDADVTLGGQSFAMQVATATTTIGVAGASCTTCTGVGGTLYTPGSTATDQHTTAMEAFGAAMFKGEVFKDSVGLGNSTPDLALNIVDISTQTDFFAGSDYAGILGLGPVVGAVAGTGAYVDAATSSGATPILGFELCADSGTMWIGGFDATHASAAPAFSPLLAIDETSNPFYSVAIDDLSLGATSIGSGAAFGDASIDTGSTQFFLPTPVFTKLLSTVNASTAFEVLFNSQTLANTDTGQCVTAAGVTAAQVDAQLPPLVTSLPAVGGGADITLTVPASQSYLSDQGGGMFCLAVVDGGTNEFATDLGALFMRAFVTVIDQKNNQIGFAPDSGCP